MSKPNPNQILAHVELLRAVDRLLIEAETVRKKRDQLTQEISRASDDDRDQEGVGHA